MRKFIDNREEGQALFVGIRKSFDSINHSILYVKIYNSGFREKILELLKDFPRNSMQFSFLHLEIFIKANY